MNTKTSKNKTAIVAFRTHADLKEKVNKILSKNGLDTSTVLNMVMQNIALRGTSPVFLDHDISPKLAKIIKSVEKEKKGDKKHFSSAQDAISFLNTL